MKTNHKLLALFMAFLLTFSGFSFVAAANETTVTTESSQTVVFIDEQPIPSYQIKGKQFVSVKRLSDYGFDLKTKDGLITITVNPEKEIAFLDESLVNVKKNDASFQKTYTVKSSKYKVVIAGKKYSAYAINGQTHIQVNSLSGLATIETAKDGLTVKLDTQKKKFQNMEQTKTLTTKSYPDEKSAGLTSFVHKFHYATYNGEFADGKKNGFGCFEYNYSGGGHLQTIHGTATGYWKDDKRHGFHIIEETETRASKETLPDEPNPGFLEQYCLWRGNFVDDHLDDGAYLSVYIRYDSLNAASSYREEGYFADGKQVKTFRLSKIDDAYRYGYRIIYEGEYVDGVLQISDEEIEARYANILPPPTEEEWKKIEENKLDYNDDGTIYVPGDLSECISELKKILSAEDLEELKNAKDTVEYHFGLGMWIRNCWIYGDSTKLSSYFYQMGIYEPDDMSSIIMDALQADLKGEKFDLDAEVRSYKMYWVMYDIFNVRNA